MKTTTLNVNLTPLLKELVESKLRAGHYQNASEVVRAEYTVFMTKIGYTPAVLDAEITKLDNLRKADEEHSKESGNAQKATDERDKAFAPVNAFRNSVMKFARRVFRTEPEQLSKLDF